MTKRETMQTMSDICDRALVLLAAQGIQEQKINLMMDLEFIDCIIDLDFDRLLAFDDGDFGHDITGIYQNWNRQAKEMENCFAPRCSKPESTEPTIDDNPGANLGIEVRIVDRENGYDVVVEFDAHIETYHYDSDTPIENGKYFAVENFTEAHKDLFTVASIATALGNQVAKPVGPTAGEQFDHSRAVNLYLMAARDLGTNLGGYDLVDLLADRTDWSLDKCRRQAKKIVADPAIVSILINEGVPDVIYPARSRWICPKCGKDQANVLRCTGCGHHNGDRADTAQAKRQRKPYAGTQFEADDEVTADVTLVHIETGDQVDGRYTGATRYEIVAQAFKYLTGLEQWDDDQAYKVLAYDVSK